MIRRLAAILAALLLLIPAAVSARADFADVDPGHWAYGYIGTCARKGIINGVGGRFLPDKTVTAAELTAIAVRAFWPEAELRPARAGEEWFAPYLEFAAETGICEGMDVSQAGTAPVCRYDLAQLLYGVIRLRAPELLGDYTAAVALIADAGAVPERFLPAAAHLFALGIMTGVDAKGTFYGNGSVTRAQAAAAVCRTLALVAEPVYIIHACGMIDGVAGTNSLEALCSAYDHGYRIVEIDFNATSDGRLVCIHDWGIGAPLSYEEFLKTRPGGRFTPLDAGLLAEFMHGHPDLRVVTDVKDDNVSALRRLAEEYPELRDSFIVQIYSEDELQPVREAGFGSVIYTLYALTWNEKTDAERIAAFAKENKLFGVTFSSELTNVEGFVRTLAGSGIPIFTHTVNDASEVRREMRMGVCGFYTDLLDLK